MSHFGNHSSAREIRDQIAFAAGAKNLVQVEREEIDPTVATGYIVSYSNELIALANLTEHVNFSGFEIIRIEDITHLDLPHPHGEFIEEALTLRGLAIPEPPEGMDLTSFKALLKSLAGSLPLVTLIREVDDADACYIGSIHTVDDIFVSIFEIDADAAFEHSPTRFLLREITRVDFGGLYEDALHQVATARGNTVPGR